MKIVGSHALKFRFPEYTKDRDPKDIDIVASMPATEAFVAMMASKVNGSVVRFDHDLIKNKVVAFVHSGPDKLIIESEIAENGNLAQEFLDLEAERAAKSTFVPETMNASMEGLYAMKMSHRYLKNSPAFLKTMRDIQLIRKYGFPKGSDIGIHFDYLDWFTRREKATYTYEHPKLNVGSKDFFSGDGIDYVYDHDTIHLVMAHTPGIPAYKKFLIDEVKVSRKLFDSLPMEIKIEAIVEEAYVLAIERAIVPFGNSVTAQASFLKAMEKICSSITSGWFREFAWENYDAAVARYDPAFVPKFYNGLVDGIVKPFSGKKIS